MENIVNAGATILQRDRERGIKNREEANSKRREVKENHTVIEKGKRRAIGGVGWDTPGVAQSKSKRKESKAKKEQEPTRRRALVKHLTGQEKSSHTKKVPP